METLVTISFLALTFVGVAKSVKTVFTTTKRVERESRGFELARQKLEEIACLPTTSVTTALNGTETLTSHNIQFTRVTSVTVNADNSRYVVVTVTGTDGVGGNATLSETLAELGNT